LLVVAGCLALALAGSPPNGPAVYEISTRPWLYEVSVGEWARACLPALSLTQVDVCPCCVSDPPHTHPTHTYAPQLSQKYGKTIMLADVPAAEWQAIAAMGMDVVWLMGVWSLGAYGLNHDRTTPSLLADYAAVLPGYTTVGPVNVLLPRLQ
jgi:hypothetical protein